LDFNERQKKLLKQYCDAAVLLVKCIKQSEFNLIPNARQEIEETLLLPIAEIERQNNESF
jgi:hypothetical protein